MNRAFLKPLAISFVVTSAISANADILFNSFGASGSGYLPGNAWSIYSVQSFAIGFSVTGSYSLSEIDVALLSSASDQLTKINLCSSNAGAPGSVIETLSVSPPSTGTRIALASTQHSLLTTGNYFITLVAGDANAQSGWCWNSDNATSTMLISPNGGSSWSSFTERTGALEVLGSAVPEPASIAVLGLGALALVRRRRTAK